MVNKMKAFERGEMVEKQASFLNLFEGQKTHQVFGSQYSNTRKPLRISFIK